MQLLHYPSFSPAQLGLTSTELWPKTTVHLCPSGTAPSPVERVRGCALYGKQLRGLLEKRVLYSVRGRAVAIAQLVVPALFTIISCLLINVFERQIEDDEPLVMKATMFETPIVSHQLCMINIIELSN